MPDFNRPEDAWLSGYAIGREGAEMTDLHRHAGKDEEERIWDFGYAAGYADGFAAGRTEEARAMQVWAHAYNEREAAKATVELGDSGEPETSGTYGNTGKYAPAGNTFVRSGQRQVSQQQAEYVQVGERRQAGKAEEQGKQEQGRVEE